MARSGVVYHGVAGKAGKGGATFGGDRQGRRGTVRDGLAERGLVRQAGCGLAGQGAMSAARQTWQVGDGQGFARQGAVRQDRRGVARIGTFGCGTAWQARQAKERLG